MFLCNIIKKSISRKIPEDNIITYTYQDKNMIVGINYPKTNTKLDNKISRYIDKQLTYFKDNFGDSDYLIDRDCKIIVIACNTASCVCSEILRKKYIDVKFIAIEPAIKLVYDSGKSENTLVMVTKGTMNSDKFYQLYNKYGDKLDVKAIDDQSAIVIDEAKKGKKGLPNALKSPKMLSKAPKLKSMWQRCKYKQCCGK